MRRRGSDAEARNTVLRVVESIQENLAEQISVDDMAHTALLSRFHFSRVFKQITGLSPGHFLSAMRLEAAKRYLTFTSLTVVEITHRVGYTSVGTFGSRFARSVGLPPTRYRELGPLAMWSPCGHAGPDRDSVTMVRGRIRPSQPGPAETVFVGLFPEPIAEGPLACGSVVDRDGWYALSHVPEGIWHLLAYSVPAAGGEPADIATVPGEPLPGAAALDGDAQQHVGSFGPVTVHPRAAVHLADVRLRPRCPLDPPVLLVPPGRSIAARS
ncbi:MAG: helix-turn-helix domain-containing protein [Pseudonocardiaceae bacterium]